MFVCHRLTQVAQKLSGEIRYFGGKSRTSGGKGRDVLHRAIQPVGEGVSASPSRQPEVEGKHENSGLAGGGRSANEGRSENEILIRCLRDRHIFRGTAQ
jgi:hypothetical protein